LRRSRQHIAAQRLFSGFPSAAGANYSPFQASTQGDLQGLMALLAKDVTIGHWCGPLETVTGGQIALFAGAFRSKWQLDIGCSRHRD